MTGRRTTVHAGDRPKLPKIPFALGAEAFCPLVYLKWVNGVRKARALNSDPPLWRMREKLYHVDLSWLIDLLSRLKSLPRWSPQFARTERFGWLSDRTAAALILQYAVGSIALRGNPAGLLHYTLNSWAKFAGGMNAIATRLKSLVQRPPTHLPRSYSVGCYCPEVCSLDASVSLRLEFRAGSTSHGGADGIVFSVPAQANVTTTVLVSSSGFRVCPPYRQIQLQPDTDTEFCEFSLQAISSGPQLVEINIIGAGPSIAIPVSITVMERSSDVSSQRSTIISRELRLAEQEDTRAIIEVNWKPGEDVEFSLWDAASPEKSFQSMGRSLHGITTGEIQDLILTHTAKLHPYVTYAYADANELREGRSAMAAFGLELFRQIVPQKLAERLKTWPPGSVIGVLTNEPWIPWELLSHDLQLGLWGDYFVIMRLPRMPVNEVPYCGKEETANATDVPTDVSTAASIIGDEIPVGTYPDWYSDLRTFPAGCQVTPLPQPTIQDVIKAAPQNDILHFTCHGRHDNQGSSFYLSLGTDILRRLQPEQVPSFRLKSGSIVFANACSSGQPLLTFREFVSFGWKFYSIGAAIFIGTLGPVPVAAAFELAERFYHFFLVEGLTAGSALRAAKEQVGGKRRNPFGVLYCLYGPASSRRRLPIDSLI